MAILAISPKTSISPCKNLYGKVDQLDQLDTGLCQLCQVGHAKNRSALSALFALLMVKVQKVQIVQCKNLHEILEIVRWKVSQESQVSHVIFLGTELLLLVGDVIKTGLNPAEKKKEKREPDDSRT